MANESDIQLVTGGQGPVVRTLNVTTYIQGVPTVVQMEVAAISDQWGNLLQPDAALTLQKALLREMRAVRKGIEMLAGQNLIQTVSDSEVDY